MAGFVLRRLLCAIPVLALVSLFAFLILQLVPGDAAVVMAGPSASAADIEAMRATLGLDRPWPERLASWYLRLLQGDLGNSLTLGTSVWQAVVERAPPTLSLALVALALTLLLGMGLGIAAACRQGGWVDALAMAIAVLGVSLPNFWVALMLTWLFAVTLGWLPSGGYVPLAEDPPRWLAHLVLPATSLAIMQMGLLARMTRSSMLEVLRQDYVRTARAKGLGEAEVVGAHALRNALIPIVTLVGIIFSLMLAGAVVIETVYSLPGIGRMVISAIQRRDLPVVQGALVLTGVLFVLVNILVDVLYAMIDPRVRPR
ncbi:MAG: ABC transporter permease [Alphaproteobacteria bacterium]